VNGFLPRDVMHSAYYVLDCMADVSHWVITTTSGLSSRRRLPCQTQLGDDRSTVKLLTTQSQTHSGISRVSPAVKGDVMWSVLVHWHKRTTNKKQYCRRGRYY